VSRGNDTHGAPVPLPGAGDVAERRGTGVGTAHSPAQPALEALAAKAAGENFPVALRVLPRLYRRRLMAVYRFARFVDDIGDEPAPAAGDAASDPGDRLRALDAVEHDLGRAFTAGLTPQLPVIREVGLVAAECAIPAEPFRMLIQANRQDQTVSRYATFDHLLGYCELSANPVGRIVLGVFGAVTPERERLSDLVCTALQLAEHWQDVAEDFARGRVYLPQEDMAAFGCTERDLEPAPPESAARPAGPADPVRRGTPDRIRELMRFETERAARLLGEGAALTGNLRGWARLAVAGYVAGGRATLAAIAAAGAGPGRLRRRGAPGRSAPPAGPGGFDVLAMTPRPGRARTAGGLILAYLTGR
jgi:squalene synthase HpnC